MIVKIIHLALQLLIILVIVYALGSWFPQMRENRFYRILEGIVEPLLEPIRKVVPYVGGVDISPAILIFILILIDRVLTR